MSNEKLILPEEIVVGYQKRIDTYEDKLGYIVYKDKEKNKLKREVSWNNWRDKEIPYDTFSNEPTEGFVLNKNVGGKNYGWNNRQMKIRVYDPRGFEIEITVDNLLYILEYNSCIQGKGLEGSYVYAWDNNQLVLIPTKSNDYQKIIEYNNFLKNDFKLKLKDLEVGTIYLNSKMFPLVYLGHLNQYEAKIDYHKFNQKNKIHLPTKKLTKKHVFYKLYGESINDGYIDTLTNTSKLKGIKGKVSEKDLNIIHKNLYKKVSYDSYISSYETIISPLNDNFENYFVEIINYLNENKLKDSYILFADKEQNPLFLLQFNRQILNEIVSLNLSLVNYSSYSIDNECYYKTENNHVLKKLILKEKIENYSNYPNIDKDEFFSILEELNLKELMKDAYTIVYKKDIHNLEKENLTENDLILNVFNMIPNFN